MPAEEISILFRYPSRGTFRGIRRRPLREFLREAAHAVAPGSPVICLITDDRELQALNLRFRGKNSPTDVLSFVSSNGVSSNGAPGEMAISLDRARSRRPASATRWRMSCVS